MKKSRNKGNALMYFPNLKRTLKLGIVVSLTTLVGSLLIVGINVGMLWLMTIG